MRWQSSGSRVALRSDFTTGGPIVKLGTKCPSMMSTWITLAPPSVARSTWSAKWAKSAERIEGASSIKTGNLGLPKGDYSPEILARRDGAAGNSREAAERESPARQCRESVSEESSPDRDGTPATTQTPKGTTQFSGSLQRRTHRYSGSAF